MLLRYRSGPGAAFKKEKEKEKKRKERKKSYFESVLSVERLGGCCCVGAGGNSKRQQEGQEAQVLDLAPLSPEHRIPQGLQKCPEGTAVPHLAQAGRRPAWGPVM